LRARRRAFQAEAVQLLARRGANVNIVEVHGIGNIVPIISARLPDRQCVTELLRFGANVSSIQQICVTSSEKDLVRECSLVESKASCSPVHSLNF